MFATKIIKILIINVFLIISLLAFERPDYSKFGADGKKSFLLLSLSTPYLPHASNTTTEKGISLVCSYPGYFSYYGQINLYFTDGSSNSYLLGIGETYLIAGINKFILKRKNSKVFLNINFGSMFGHLTTFGNEYLGSIGVSFLKPLPPKSRIEFVFDIYFNHGMDGDWMIIHDKIYSRGILAGVNYTYNITDNLLINIGASLSFIQYRYMRQLYSSPLYEYVTWQREKKQETLPEDARYSVDPKWDSHIIIPIGITISYHF